jgi:hypothetical protein
MGDILIYHSQIVRQPTMEETLLRAEQHDEKNLFPILPRGYHWGLAAQGPGSTVADQIILAPTRPVREGSDLFAQRNLDLILIRPDREHRTYGLQDNDIVHYTRAGAEFVPISVNPTAGHFRIREDYPVVHTDVRTLLGLQRWQEQYSKPAPLSVTQVRNAFQEFATSYK